MVWLFLWVWRCHKPNLEYGLFVLGLWHMVLGRINAIFLIFFYRFILIYHSFVYPWVKQAPSIEFFLFVDVFIPGHFGLGLWHMVLRRINSKIMTFLDTFILIYHNIVYTWVKQAKTIEKYHKFSCFENG